MFLIDDLLLAPLRGVHFVASSIYDAVQEEVEQERRALRSELNDLYMELEAGNITEEEFDRREEEVLDRLDELQALEDRLAAREVPSEAAPDDPAADTGLRIADLDASAGENVNADDGAPPDAPSTPDAKDGPEAEDRS
jgi:hypothetical protein